MKSISSRELLSGNARDTIRGSAFLELAICLPVLLILIGGIIDTSRALNQYMQLSRVAYETSRFGASLAGLESGCYGKNSEVVGCKATGVPIFQRQVMQRLQGLLTSHNLAAVSESSSVLVRNSAGDDNFTVNVRLQQPYQPVFFNQLSLMITVDATAPYLFSSS